MLIRPMIEIDLDTIVMLEKQLFSSPWSKDNYIYEITKNPFSKNWVLEKEGRVIGYIGYWLLGDQTQITTLGICSKEQGKGYAKQLLDFCLKETKEKQYPIITLEVRVSNTTALRLYERYGFEVVTIRKNYYQDTGEDAYLMCKRMEV